VIHESPERLITFYEPGPPVESYRGNWNGKNHLLSYFWRQRPYVLHVLWDTYWEPKHLYVDIATGTDWADGIVRYVDLDLDLILRHGSTTVELDDEDEFETHRVRWNYPEALVKECWAAVEEVRRLLKAGDEPFAPTMFAWRPAKPQP
jgi:predicted RNA-binding protein associated with RNAse of E/G family